MDITQSATLSSFASLSNSQSALIQANQKPGVNISFTLQTAASRSLSSDQAVIVGTTVMTKKETAVQASSKSMQSRLLSPRIVLSSALKKKSAQTYENMENDSLNERT
jgi:phosphoenolpyruvate-protein kinase (PTS system EI component)